MAGSTRCSIEAGLFARVALGPRLVDSDNECFPALFLPSIQALTVVKTQSPVMSSQAARMASDETVGSVVSAQVSVAKLDHGRLPSQDKDPALTLDRSPTTTKRVTRLRPKTIRFNIRPLQ